MKRLFFLISLIVSQISFAQIIYSEDDIVSGEKIYNFPREIDTLQNDFVIFYLLQIGANNDSVIIVNDTTGFKDYSIMAKAVYLKRMLALEYFENRVDYFVNGHYASSVEYRDDGSIERESHYWGYYTFDSIGKMSSKVYEGLHNIDGMSITCEDSVWNFFSNGKVMSKEYYKDCDKSGEWVNYDTENNIVRKRFYSKSVLIKEEHYDFAKKEK